MTHGCAETEEKPAGGGTRPDARRERKRSVSRTQTPRPRSASRQKGKLHQGHEGFGIVCAPEAAI